MNTATSQIVLGSRSPRRLELLSHIVPANSIVVLPPRSPDEADFVGVTSWEGIEQRLSEIARSKSDDVVGQVREQIGTASGRCGVPVLTGPAGVLQANFDCQSASKNIGTSQTLETYQGAHAPRSPVVVTADTVIVGTSEQSELRVLGQPPETDDWPDVVRGWFQQFYFGKAHVAATAVCVTTLDGRRAERVVQSQVTFRADGARWLEWYLSTGEPRGKAGGYAIQEAGSLFVEKIEGSPSNVVGLPLVELLELFEQLQVTVRPAR